MKKATYISILLTPILFCAPLIASASSIYLETDPGTISPGDTVVVRAYLDADASSNVLEGTIHISPNGSNIKVDTITLAGSAFTFWPRTPSLSTNGADVTFTGGAPGGLVGQHQLIFSMVVTAEKTGATVFTPTNLTLYANDGKGTPVSTMSRALTFTAVPTPAGHSARNEWQGVLSKDTQAPEQFTIAAGQDPSVYEGKKYLYFQTSDTQSGVDYYMVKENDAQPVRSGSVYVLQNQTGPVNVVVTAYDKAGNVRTASYYTSSQRLWLTLLTLAALLLMVGLYIFYRIKKQKRYI